MKRNWWYKFIFFAFVVVVSTMAIIPTFLDLKEDSAFPVKSKVSLGLDLQGGLYIVLGIDFKKVYLDEMKNYAQKLVTLLKDQEGIQATLGEKRDGDSGDPRYSINIVNATDQSRAKDIISQYYQSVVRLTNQKSGELEYGLQRSYTNDIEQNSVSKSIEVIRNRIDEFGVTEPEITALGSDRIVVQLPGVKDIERAKELIGKTAKLEFRMVNDQVPQADIQNWLSRVSEAGITYQKGERYSIYLAKVNDFLQKELPKGYELAFEKVVNKFTNETMESIPYLVESSSNLTGEDLQDAYVNFDPQTNRPYVGLTFKARGSKVFADLTEKNVGKQMAIVLDGNVYSAPAINERIGGGSAQINLGQGNRDSLLAQARDLALVLRAGALPIELEFQEQRIVGPSLGSQSIKQAETAGLIGCTLVFLFIVFYYKVSGVIAMATLVVNVLIVLAFLVGLEATLTLPGIAGIALTIGMAVDANIIIYERIKEELRVGAANLQAVEAGFGKAFWTILDANLTTAAAGFALINFGTGPIRGFAVTLLIGIFATVYSSYFVGQMLFEWYMDRVRGKKLSI